MLNTLEETEYFEKIRLEEKRKKQRRQRNILIIAIIMVAAAIYILSPLSRINTIVITGNNHLTNEQIREQANINENQFSLLRPAFLITSSLESSNYFQSIDVSKTFSGQVKINVVENRLLFYMIENDIPTFYDEQGNRLVFDKDNVIRFKAEIPQLIVSDEFTDEIKDKLVNRLGVLEPSVLLEISEINHSPLVFDKENFIFTMSGAKEIYIHANLDDLVKVGANYHSFSINSTYACSLIQFINDENRAIVRRCP